MGEDVTKGTAKKVFGIGLSKTGTTSLYSALHILGLRAGTYRHMRELGLNEWFGGDFRKDYLVNFDAVTDLPIASFFPQLYYRYPSSKFILTVRNKASWLKSCQHQLSEAPADAFSHKTRLITYGCVRRAELSKLIIDIEINPIFSPDMEPII